MSQTEKALYFRALKAAGVKFEHHYREYSTEDLRTAYEHLEDPPPLQPAVQQEPPPVQPPVPSPDTTGRAEPEWQPMTQEELNRVIGAPPQNEEEFPPQENMVANPIPTREADPNEFAGQRQNTQAPDEPIRVDADGLIWYQEEVRKPAMPKPRARRVLKYMDTGVQEETVRSGEYTETFEVAGTQRLVPSEVKITMPSYQVGIYKDPRLPFRIHIYNEQRGFDLFEVQNFYGGPDLVPSEAKRIYIENVLCYDIRSTVRAIEMEYRRLQLQGRIEESV